VVTSRKIPLVVCSVVVALTGCSGGGGGDSESAPPPAVTPAPITRLTLTGTVTTRTVIPDAEVIVKDKRGNSARGKTDKNGAYGVDTTTLEPPFLVSAVTPTGTLYSVSADASAAANINVTPLTSLVVGSWYNAQGIPVTTAFNAPTTNPAPAPREVGLMAGVVQNTVQLWLDQAGVSTDFNLISTPFTVNGTGIAAVLNQATVNTSSGQITITDGLTTQNSTVTATGGTMAASTTTTAPSATTVSAASTVVPTQTAQQQALDGITATLTELAAVVNAKGTALTPADVKPFIDSAIFHDGLGIEDVAAEIDRSLGIGATISFQVLQILSLNTTSNLARAIFILSKTQNGTTARQREEFFFKKVGNKWLLSGNNQIANLQLQAEARNEQHASIAGIDGPNIEVTVRVPTGVISGATITGGGFWSFTPLNGVATANVPRGILAAKPFSVEPIPVGPTSPSPPALVTSFENYSINSGLLSALVPAGSIFTFRLARKNGVVERYDVPLNAFTTERISITSPTANTLASARLGQQLNVVWTLPRTYAIQELSLTAIGYTGSQTNPLTRQCETRGPILGATTTTAAITIPSSCEGLPVKEVNLHLVVEGINGERSEVTHFFK
jgi:hypothetical protein